MRITFIDDARPLPAEAMDAARGLGFAPYRAADADDAWRRIGRDAADAVLFDGTSPQAQGWALSRRVRAAGLQRCVYLMAVVETTAAGEGLPGDTALLDDLLLAPLPPAAWPFRLALADRVVRLEGGRRELERTAADGFRHTVQALERALHIHDAAIGAHCRRVGRIAREMARRHPAVDDDGHRWVEAAGRLHDLGMLGVAAPIRAKRRNEMAGGEAERYRAHPVLGALILGDIDCLRPLAPLVRAHHEQYNGRGFPDRLAGDAIPCGAQIIAAASIYDNLLHRGRVPPEDLPERLQRFRGYQLSPAMVDLLLEMHLEAERHREDQAVVEVAIGDLRPGMLVARPVRLKTGAVVVPAQTELAAHGIEKLRQHDRLGVIAPCIHVFAYSVRP